MIARRAVLLAALEPLGLASARERTAFRGTSNVARSGAQIIVVRDGRTSPSSMLTGTLPRPYFSVGKKTLTYHVEFGADVPAREDLGWNTQLAIYPGEYHEIRKPTYERDRF
jgi:hypothetical protein